MKQLIYCILEKIVLRIRPDRVAALWASLLSRYVEDRSAVDALRIVLDLDNRLYRLQGTLAVQYGEGVHTKHRHTGYHDFFCARISGVETVLDIGCGIGAVAYDIATRRGAAVTGIDLNRESIELARKRPDHEKLTYIVGDALTDLPSNHYDVVILSNVLEHIEHRRDFLNQVNARISPSRWLIRVPLFERDWRVPLKQEIGIDWRLDPTHCTEYTVESFQNEAAGADLRIEHLEVRWGEIWSELCPGGV